MKRDKKKDMRYIHTIIVIFKYSMFACHDTSFTIILSSRRMFAHAIRTIV